ncbi:MAG TPA: hypothetical protein VK700_00435 [Steroidobacteraceae bacterium]|nr:hypothetical protein [Steroidobacteraceae bacterium]
MKLYGPDRRELMTVSSIERSGHQLLIKGKVFGTMPLSASLTPAQARAGLKLLGLRGLFFVFTMLFRGGQ